MARPKYIAFYSYRGGVGRTLAMCNVAARMARDGDRVLAVDMDFEAPGASVLLGEGRAAERPGLIDYLERFQEEDKAPDLADFLSDVRPAGYRLQLLAAGRMDKRYPQRVAKLDLVGLFEEEGAMGRRMFSSLRESINAQPTPPHYVLVDSRPGLSVAGALAVQMFADEVVLLFGLNRQSLAGLKWVKARMEHDNRLVHYVASPTPTAREGYEKEFGEARTALGKPLSAELPFEEDVLWKERLMLGPADREKPLAIAYDDLTQAVRSPDDVHILVTQAMERLGTPGQAPLVRAALSRALHVDPTDIRVLVAHAHFEAVSGDDNESLRHAENAVELNADEPSVWELIDNLYDKYKDGDTEIRRKLEELYTEHLGDQNIDAARLLVWFSVKLRKVITNGRGFDSPEVTAVLSELREKANSLSPADVKWGELTFRLPLSGKTTSDLRNSLAHWRKASNQAGLEDLADSIQAAADRANVFTDIAGVVEYFGPRGFGFLSTDDGERGVLFHRNDCDEFGKHESDFIPIGEAAIFDLEDSDDPSHPWHAARVRFPDIEDRW